jgi:hypothetical protein
MFIAGASLNQSIEGRLYTATVIVQMNSVLMRDLSQVFSKVSVKFEVTKNSIFSTWSLPHFSYVHFV